MAETPVSLLERLRLRPDDEAWKQLVDLYAPLLHGWLRRYFVQQDDADDLVQEVFRVLVIKMPEFEHSRQRGAFRSWLRTVLRNCAANRQRAAQALIVGGGTIAEALEQLEEPDSALSRRWDEEHNEHVARYFLGRLQGKFEPTTWQAFTRVVMEGKKTAEVAAELGISANAVRLAKSHVLHWLRTEAAGFID